MTTPGASVGGWEASIEWLARELLDLNEADFGRWLVGRGGKAQEGSSVGGRETKHGRCWAGDRQPTGAEKGNMDVAVAGGTVPGAHEQVEC